MPLYVSSQITLAAPPAGGGGGRWQHEKKKRITKPNTEPTQKAEDTPGEGREVSPPAPNPIKTESCQARRRRESQLTTVAPRDSSTFRWIPRGNALATWAWRHQEPRTAPVEVV